MVALDFDQVKADVALRMISNFSRCLVLYALIDTEAALLDLRCLIVEAGRQRHRWPSSENHLEFVENIVSDLSNGKVPDILTEKSPYLDWSLSRFWIGFNSGAIVDL